MDKGLNEIISNWMVKADNDIKTAKLLLEAEDPINDTICFHCQQAVEKYLKLYIVTKSITPDRTHSTAVLLQQCIKLDSDFSELNGIEHLTDYAVAVRYPDDFYIPSNEETEEAYTLALKTKDFVLKRIKYN